MGRSAPPVPTKYFLAWLKSHHCTEGKGKKHDKWTCPGSFRSITFDRSDKEIPYLHVSNNVKNMGYTMADFKAFVKKEFKK